MAADASKAFGKFLGKFRERFEKLESAISQGGDEMELIHTVIQRIDLEGEQAQAGQASGQPGAGDEEVTYERLMKRLKWQLSRSGLSAEDVIRNYQGDVQAVLLHRSYEKFKGEESSLLRERFIEMGWKNIQPNLWVLPPNRTPKGPVTSGELKVWLRKMLAKPFGREFDYAFPVVAVIDMKKATADKKGIRKMPTARTIYNVLDPNEVVPASHLYSVMKSRGLGVRDIILEGNIPFLASAFATTDELMAIQENEDAISASLKQMTGSQSVSLQDIANLGPDLVADAFGSTVSHGRDLARRLIVEAQFWMRTLGGSVPTPGPMPATTLPSPQPVEEKAEPVQPAEAWGKPKEEAEAEEKPAASQEQWYEPGEKSEEEAEDTESATQAVAEARVSDDEKS